MVSKFLIIILLLIMLQYRNPEHHQRPSFENICTYLQQPVDHVVCNSQHDETICSNCLGADLQAATEMYSDLQETYLV